MTHRVEHERVAKPAVTLLGKVEKIIRPLHSAEREKARTAIEGADHLYREIRIDNRLTDENGQEVRLKPGADVDIKIEANPEGTTSEASRRPKTQ